MSRFLWFSVYRLDLTERMCTGGEFQVGGVETEKTWTVCPEYVLEECKERNVR